MLAKITSLVKQYQYDIFLGITFALIAIISFNLGRAHINQNSLLTVGDDGNLYQASINNSLSGQQATSSTSNKTDLRVVASKNSKSKLYHFTWCSGAKQIKEENKIWFSTEKDAIAAGYTLAGNCK